MAARRSYGTGSLTQRRGQWFGQWRAGGKLRSRVIGPIRQPGTRDGLTRTMAEKRLREIMLTEAAAPPPVNERLTIEFAGAALIRALTAEGRKPSTLQDYESALRVHLAPYFGMSPIGDIDRRQIEAFVSDQRGNGAAPKSIRNRLGLLHSIFTYAEREGWARGNPVKLARKPRSASADPDLRVPWTPRNSTRSRGPFPTT